MTLRKQIEKILSMNCDEPKLVKKLTDQILSAIKSELNPIKLSKALARAYCTKENSHKVLDPTLIKAMVDQITRSL